MCVQRSGSIPCMFRFTSTGSCAPRNSKNSDAVVRTTYFARRDNIHVTATPPLCGMCRASRQRTSTAVRYPLTISLIHVLSNNISTAVNRVHCLVHLMQLVLALATASFHSHPCRKYTKSLWSCTFTYGCATAKCGTLMKYACLPHLRGITRVTSSTHSIHPVFYFLSQLCQLTTHNQIPIQTSLRLVVQKRSMPIFSAIIVKLFGCVLAFNFYLEKYDLGPILAYPVYFSTVLRCEWLQTPRAVCTQSENGVTRVILRLWDTLGGAEGLHKDELLPLT